VLTSRLLLDTPGLNIAEVRCTGQHAQWSPPEPITAFAIVLPRRGVFHRRVAGVQGLVDPATGYVEMPGTEQEIAHPAGGDLCTTITLPIPDGHVPAPAGPVHVSPWLSAAHRLLITQASSGADVVKLTDLATELVAAVLTATPSLHGSTRAHRRLADETRQILAGEPNCPLPELAHRLAVSPWHLSRVFHQTTGVTLRQFRIRLRTTAALDLLVTESRSLAMIAADTGFTDQAHLTRTLRAQTGQPPGRLRALLKTVNKAQPHGTTSPAADSE